MAIETSTIIKAVIAITLFLVVFLTFGKPILNAMEKGIALTKGQIQEYTGSNPPMSTDIDTKYFTAVPQEGIDKPNIAVDTKYFGEVQSSARPLGQPTMIVLHHTGGSTASGAISALKTRGLSVHYIIDTNGIIYYLVSESRKAYHAGCCLPSESTCCGKESCFLCINNNPPCRNEESIGIEIVNSGNHADEYTNAQYESLKKLLADIQGRRGITINNEHVIAHFQISPDKWDPSPNFDWSEIGLDEPRPPGGLVPPVPASAGYP